MFKHRIRTLVSVVTISILAAASASAQTHRTTANSAGSSAHTPTTLTAQSSSERSGWPRAYIVGRGGLTFGTRTAPLLGAEIGGDIAPFLQAYGSFEWHRDISPSAIEDLSVLISHLAGAEVNYRLPSFIGIGRLKVIASHGRIRPYGIGGLGYGHVNGTVEVEGKDVTGLLATLGFLDRSDITFNKVLFEAGAGISASNGRMYTDTSYRFRKFLQTGEPINMSGLYVGVGVGF